MNQILLGDNLDILKTVPSESFELIYIDPPFNTGKRQVRKRTSTVRDESGERIGFGGHRYRTTEHASSSYSDSFDDYLGFLESRLVEAQRVLTQHGSLFVHLDYREVHYVKVLLDRIFGRECFQNEIVWAYDYGGRSKSRWSAKHDNILWYSNDPKKFTFNFDEMDRIPYMAPGLVGPEKAKRGKTPTDVWWHTIVPPSSKERTGYATQKPLGVLRRVINVHSNVGDRVLDFFAGSGTTGAAALEYDREFMLIDENPEAIEVMRERFAGTPVEFPEAVQLKR